MAAYPKNKNDDPSEFEDVYAGPGMMDELDPTDPDEPETEAAPAPEPERSKEPDISEFECVYAGPEYFEAEKPDIIIADESAPEEEKTPEPEQKKPEFPPEALKAMFDDRSNKLYEAVYAGPQFMMAYAGPQMNNNGAFIGMMSVMNTQQPEEKKKKCELCGAEMPVSAKFCGKCGSKFKEIKFCPGCGSPVVEGSKFCCECGALLK